jgi:DNA-binding transcriptional MerR regulator
MGNDALTPQKLFGSREVARAAGLPYQTLMRWLQSGLLVRRGPARRVGRGGGLLWSERDVTEARIAAALRDYVSRAEGPLGEIMKAVQGLEALPKDPALRLDALGRPQIVAYDAEQDDLRLLATPEVRRRWRTRQRTPRQEWVEQHEIAALDGDGTASELESGGTLDLFGPTGPAATRR